jgi:hypothetical protein
MSDAKAHPGSKPSSVEAFIPKEFDRIDLVEVKDARRETRSRYWVTKYIYTFIQIYELPEPLETLQHNLAGLVTYLPYREGDTVLHGWKDWAPVLAHIYSKGLSLLPMPYLPYSSQLERQLPDSRLAVIKPRRSRSSSDFFFNIPRCGFQVFEIHES